MDKAEVLSHFLESKGVLTLLGGQMPASVISTNKYTAPLIAAAEVTDIDHAIHTALSGEVKSVTLIGPEGSGKTTALEKLIVDWAKGEHLQNFSYVFHFRFRELNPLEGALSLETLIQQHHHLESMPLVLQKPEDVLFVFDDLHEYKHSLDPSDHTLCSDPSQAASVSCLVASLLHGSLLRGAAFVVATRPTECVEFLSSTQVEVLGFLKPQREAYFNGFFTDPAAANKALMHMERTLGFYDFCTAPKFCWTLCCIYKSLMDSGAKLPETVSQLLVDILVHLIQPLSLNEACTRELVLALGRMASHCSLQQDSSCTKEQVASFGLQRFLTSVLVFLRVDGELESDACVFSFHSQMMQEFVLAVSFFLDKPSHEGVEKMLEKHKGKAKFLDLFLSGLSEPVQHRPLETLTGEFNSDQIKDFKCWFKSSSEVTLEGCNNDEHYRCFHLLHQAQNESLVKEIITSSARTGMSYDSMSLQDCVALTYVVTSLGKMELFNLYGKKDLTEEMAEALVPAMSLSQSIDLTNCTLSSGVVFHLAPAMSLSHSIDLSECLLSTEAVSHLSSALSRALTRELNLSHSGLETKNFKILCAGLRSCCKLQTLNLLSCGLTEASCEDLVPVLTSNTSQLCMLVLTYNPLGDQGLIKLCKAMHSPHCKLQELQLGCCGLTAASMEDFSAALCSGQSQLRKVDLTQNEISDSGVEALCKSLQHPLCNLQSINLFDCQLTGACCSHLKEALMSEHCSLSELDLSVNELGQEAALLLCQGLRRLDCPMEKLGLTRCELTLPVFQELGSLLKSGTCKLKSLSVGLNDVGDQGVKHIWEAVAHPSCLLEDLDVEMTNLTDACAEDMCAAIRASKTLKSLNMGCNSLTDASVPALVQVVQDSSNMEQLELSYNPISEDVFDMMFACGKMSF